MIHHLSMEFANDVKEVLIRPYEKVNLAASPQKQSDLAGYGEKLHILAKNEKMIN